MVMKKKGDITIIWRKPVSRGLTIQMVSTNEKEKGTDVVNEMETTNEVVLVPEVAGAFGYYQQLVIIATTFQFMWIRTGNMKSSNVIELVLEYQ